MKWLGIYLAGYFFVVVGVLAALWRVGVLERIGAGWTVIGAIIAIGLGVMLAVSRSGNKETIEITK
jgi:uncharacterized membrane protein HdeD (DUF308 family)